MKLASILILPFILAFSGAANAKTFTFMSYNVENLFDTLHDEGKDDYTYLPLRVKRASREVQKICSEISNDYYRETCFNLDWSEKVLNSKIQNVAKVIKSVNAGKGPDVLVLVEVENKKVLAQLIREGLKSLGYKHLSLLEGPDARGVDVAIVSRFPIVGEKLHIVNLEGVSKDTRGILQADIKIEDKIISVFGNHWPSQSNPSEARVIAAQTLLDAALESKANMVIAAGDFNSLDSERPHGINQVLKPYFELADEKIGGKVEGGSHWFRGEWSFLDKIMILRNGSRQIKPSYGTFKAHKMPWMLQKKVWRDYQTGRSTTHFIPRRFDERAGTGFSDHLPLVMDFQY